MRRAWMAIGVVALMSCAKVGSETEFLHTGSQGWNAWLNARADVTFTRMTPRDILAYLTGPADIVVEEKPALDETLPEFDAATMTRREAIRRVAEKAGVAVAWGTAGGGSTAEPREFLGLLETESQKNPSGVTTVSEVRKGEYPVYQQLKADGRIKHEARIAGFVYYSTEVSRDVSFPNGTSAMFIVTERFKAKVPAGAE